MGWWSATILGGDAPLDVLSSIAREFGGANSELDWKSDPGRLKASLEASNVDVMLAFIKGSYDGGTVAQVMALMHAKCGAKLPDPIRDAAIAACRDEDVSEWSNPSERRFYLGQFIAMLEAYDNQTPTEPEREGAYQKFMSDRSLQRAA